MSKLIKSLLILLLVVLVAVMALGAGTGALEAGWDKIEEWWNNTFPGDEPEPEEPEEPEDTEESSITDGGYIMLQGTTYAVRLG